MKSLITFRVLLHCPFTPYVVLFTHIIANPLSTASDLQLLEDFVGSLQSLAHISQGVAKLAHICRVFWRVAELYSQAKKKESEMQSATAATTGMGMGDDNGTYMEPEMTSFGEIDDYFAAIGFALPTQQKQQQTASSVNENFMPTVGLGATQDRLTSGDASIMGDNDAVYLNEWFYRSSSLMGLLEQDLSSLGSAPGGFWNE